MVKQIFVNLPVKDLEKTKAFFTALGFGFNPKFTDEKAACLVLGENIFAMLITEPFFKTFTPKRIANTATHVEVLKAINVESRSLVDELFQKAIAAGGTAGKQQDYGWMYSHGFEDLDGHIWEVFWQDESKKPQ